MSDPLLECKILECKPTRSTSPTAPSMEAEHSRSAMDNGWFIGFISWETEMPVFLHGLSPLVAWEMESGGKCH